MIITSNAAPVANLSWLWANGRLVGFWTLESSPAYDRTRHYRYIRGEV